MTIVLILLRELMVIWVQSLSIQTTAHETEPGHFGQCLPDLQGISIELRISSRGSFGF